MYSYAQILFLKLQALKWQSLGWRTPFSMFIHSALSSHHGLQAQLIPEQVFLVQG